MTLHEGRTMSKKKPRHQRASVEYSFSDGSKETIGLVDQTADQIIQFALMAKSDDPELREIGKEKIKMVAEFCIAGQFYLSDQRPKSRKPRSTYVDGNGVGFSLKSLARELRSRHPEERPRQLWPHLIAELDKRGLNPTEDVRITARGDKQPIIIFEQESKDDRFTLASFRKALNDIKKEKS